MFKNIVIALMLFSGMAASHATIITFDPAPLWGGARSESSYEESGVLFSGSFGHASSSSSGGASNSSSGYLNLASGGSLRFEMSDSSLFSLGLVDLAEYSTVFPVPITITFTGYYVNGDFVSQSFTTDGLIDSIGGTDDFETFSFGSGFNNLAYAETNTEGFAMDNLEINAVPLPGVVYLFISGIFMIVGFANIKKQ